MFPILRKVLLLTCLSITSQATIAASLDVPSGIDVAPWRSLLAKYVDDRGLVAYGRWKGNPADMELLEEFIAGYGRTNVPASQGPERIAALINAYNAFTIRWILEHFPTESIRELDGSWDVARWNIGGTLVSLDQIEHEHLRPLFGWRVHATIVCAARSCPPLQPMAFEATNLTALTEQAWRKWLGRNDLNEFDAASGYVRVSLIFKWFKADFTGDGELATILERYGPPAQKSFLARRKYKMDYLDYDWGLNDQGKHGQDYRPGLFKRLF